MVDEEKRGTLKKLGVGIGAVVGVGGGGAYALDAYGETDDRIDPGALELKTAATIQEHAAEYNYDTVVPADNVEMSVDRLGPREDGEGDRYAAVATGYLRSERTNVCNYDLDGEYGLYELADDLEDAAMMMFDGLHAELRHHLPQNQDGVADVVDRYVVAFDNEYGRAEAQFSHDEIQVVAQGSFEPGEDSRADERFRTAFKQRLTARCKEEDA